MPVSISLNLLVYSYTFLREYIERVHSTTDWFVRWNTITRS
jgi:hypothetical protein